MKQQPMHSYRGILAVVGIMSLYLARSAHVPGPAPAAYGAAEYISTYRVTNGTCYGSGHFEGSGRFTGAGLFQIFNGTFSGYGNINITDGTFSGNATCNATKSTFFSLSPETTLTGDGTVKGNGTFLVPSGTFAGSGQYTGSKVTYFGGLASFLAISGRAFGNQTVIGRSISCSSDEYGAFVGTGTADGVGEFLGVGTLDDTDGEFIGTGVFTGIGDCEGARVVSSV